MSFRSIRLVLLVSFTLLLLLASPTLRATTTICDNISGNLVMNCGFELGVVNAAPLDWVVDAGFTLHLGTFNRVVTSAVNSGNNALQFGNFDSEPAAGISQVLTDTPGQTYTVSFFAFAPVKDAGSFLDAQINGTNEVSLTGAAIPNSYTEFTFSFTGTGSDTLGFLSDNSPSENYLDDVSVVSNGTLVTPEPTSIILLGSGLTGLCLRRRRLQKA